MKEYQYTTVPGKLKDLFDKIREVGIPERATTKWLESVGFKSKNDRSMLKILIQIGFIDESGLTSDRWKKYRGANYQQVMAEGIIEGYKDLFDLYPDVQKRTNKEIEDFISTHSVGGKQVITKTVSTIKTLCDLADFEIDSSIKEPQEEKQTTQLDSEPNIIKKYKAPLSQELHIDIQIHISPDTSPELIDEIFSSMAKHFYKS